MVYSTDPHFQFQTEEEGPTETLPASEQVLWIQIDKKQRGGKTVTLVAGFQGKEEDLEILGKELRNFCGTGGSAKAGEILVQGDQREKVLQYLLKKGYQRSKKK